MEDVAGILDGRGDRDRAAFVTGHIGRLCNRIGYPCFLRTGHTSGKHDWHNTCYVLGPAQVEGHVLTLIEHSAMADFLGLPVTTWAARELISTKPLFEAFWGGMPITREFRVFTRQRVVLPVHAMQPYWPATSIEQPSKPDWHARLMAASEIDYASARHLLYAAEMAHGIVNLGDEVVEPRWAVDFLQDRSGRWWLTDMAPADLAYRWDPAWRFTENGYRPGSDGPPPAPGFDWEAHLELFKAIVYKQDAKERAGDS